MQGEWEVMKPPKEPKTWKRPRLYYQPTNHIMTSRIRIIYPDGSSEWMQDCYWEEGSYGPCWATDRVTTNGPEFPGQRASGFYGKHKTPRAALVAMRTYDEIKDWKPAIFCGEL